MRHLLADTSISPYHASMKTRALGILILGLLIGLSVAGCSSTGSKTYDFTSQGHWGGGSVWREMAPHIRLASRSDLAHSQAQLNWLVRHQAYIERTTRNAAPYVYYIYTQTRKRGMPAELALLPMIESAYNPFVYSHSGATGLWQMMPGTASGFGLQIDWWYDGRRDIVASTSAALNYLQYLHKLFGDWLLAIAAYNCGEGTVANAIRHNKALHRSTNFWSLPLPPETRAYVPQLLAWSAIVKNPSHYHLSLVDVPSRQPFEAVQMNQPLELKEVAHMAHVNADVVHQLNPGFRRSTTSPDHSYNLLLPKESMEIFKLEFSRTPKLTNNTEWVYYVVKPGDTLNSVARKYQTTTKALAENNHLPDQNIHPNQKLLISKSKPRKMPRVVTEDARYGADHVPGPQQHIHTVAHHDSLNKIARQYGVSERQIQYWNGLGRGEKPQVDRKLVLWLKHPIRSYHAYQSSHNSTRYQVKAGDNLGKIAQRHHVSVRSIQAANGLKGTAIRKGQWLVIPGNNTAARAPSRTTHPSKPSSSNHQPRKIKVKPGQTLYGLSRQYHVSPQQLASWNHLTKSSSLKAGQTLLIY